MQEIRYFFRFNCLPLSDRTRQMFNCGNSITIRACLGRARTWGLLVRLILGAADSDVDKFHFLRVRTGAGKRAASHRRATLTRVSLRIYAYEFDPPFKFSTRQALDRDPLRENHPNG